MYYVNTNLHLKPNILKFSTMTATPEVRYPKFGERFSRLMNEKGWNVTQLAAIAGPDGSAVTYATIARLMKGQTRPRPALQARLAELLGVSESELIGDDAPASRRLALDDPLLFSKPKELAIAPRAQPAPDTLEWRMGRIIALQKQIAAAEAIKPELATLISEVGSELARLKYLTEPTT
jgi:transcriptional regulator with XRE-family HTH domain